MLVPGKAACNYAAAPYGTRPTGTPQAPIDDKENGNQQRKQGNPYPPSTRLQVLRLHHPYRKGLARFVK